MKYDVIIVDEKLNTRIWFTADSYQFYENGLIKIQCRDNGNIHYFLMENEYVVIKPCHIDKMPVLG